jgi:hypothetical protein
VQRVLAKARADAAGIVQFAFNIVMAETKASGIHCRTCAASGIASGQEVIRALCRDQRGFVPVAFHRKIGRAPKIGVIDYRRTVSAPDDAGKNPYRRGAGPAIASRERSEG